MYLTTLSCQIFFFYFIFSHSTKMLSSYSYNTTRIIIVIINIIIIIIIVWITPGGLRQLHFRFIAFCCCTLQKQSKVTAGSPLTTLLPPSHTIHAIHLSLPPPRALLRTSSNYLSKLLGASTNRDTYTTRIYNNNIMYRTMYT